jgi:hypothetical protein
VLYKLALYDADNALIWTVDNVSSVSDGIFAGPVAGTTATFSGALTAASGTFSGNVQMASLNGGAVSLRNSLINGNFDVWQRGTSFVNPASVYTADRWIAGGTSSTLSRTTALVTYGTYAANFTANAATNSLIISQTLESTAVNLLKGKTVTFSFSYSASTAQPAGSLTISVQKNATADTSSGGTFTSLSAISGSSSYSPTTSAQIATITVAVPSDGTANGLKVNIQTTNITNGSSVYVYQCQLEVGPVATPFEQRPIGMELALCQRYFEIGAARFDGYAAAAAQGIGYQHTFKATKRAVPTLAYGSVSVVNASVFDARLPATDSLFWYAAATAAGSVTWSGNWTATSEL